MPIPVLVSGLFAPVRDLGVGDALEDWRWRVGQGARPLLLTALGDLFLTQPRRFFRGGGVSFLDTMSGRCRRVASSYEELRELLTVPELEAEWLQPGLVAALRESGARLREGECYSPKLLPALGGALEAANFSATDWRVHLAITGQLHQVLRNVPDGTRVSFEIVE